jgi:hypothetical protein
VSTDAGAPRVAGRLSRAEIYLLNPVDFINPVSTAVVARQAHLAPQTTVPASRYLWIALAS